MRFLRALFVFYLLVPGLDPCRGAAVERVIPLSLDQFLQMVAEQNESVQMRILEVEAKRVAQKAEKGAFEPEVFGEYNHEQLKRQNTVAEARSQGNLSLFKENNNVYQGGVESLIPTGAKIRLGYTLRDLDNNLQKDDSSVLRGATNGEFSTFFGVSLSQPLLKNAGISANMARIRIAALSSRIAFQEYRKQAMLVLSTAEATYWRMYLLQEQLKFLQQSVETAGTVLNDSRVRLDAGRGSELDVLEARAGLASRQSLLAQAEQKLQETANDMASLCSKRRVASGWRIQALTDPRIFQDTPALSAVYAAAFDSNPDYLMQIEKAALDGVTLKYARNQRLPELNLKGAYGFSGLADDPNSSWDQVTTGDWPSWSVGVELRIPLGGGVRGRNEVQAARLREQQSLLGVRSMETQLLNSLDSAVRRLSESRLNASNYQAQVALNQSALDAALTRFEVGQIESRKVLEIESSLLEAQSSEVEAIVNHRQALIELRFLEGSLLRRHNLDFSQRDLELATDKFVRASGLNRERYAEFIRAAQSVQAAGGRGYWPGERETMAEMREKVKARAGMLDRDEGFLNPETLSNDAIP